MSKLERVRETISGQFTLDQLAQRARSGWRLAAVEWEREVDGVEAPAPQAEDVPFGLRISQDCSKLEEDPTEMEILTLMMEGITQDLPLGRISEDLNLNGYLTRDGLRWTQPAVFKMLPRLIEVGPRILSSPAWPERRQKLRAAI